MGNGNKWPHIALLHTSWCDKKDVHSKNVLMRMLRYQRAWGIIILKHLNGSSSRKAVRVCNVDKDMRKGRELKQPWLSHLNSSRFCVLLVHRYFTNTIEKKSSGADSTERSVCLLYFLNLYSWEAAEFLTRPLNPPPLLLCSPPLGGLARKAPLSSFNSISSHAHSQSISLNTIGFLSQAVMKYRWICIQI